MSKNFILFFLLTPLICSAQLKISELCPINTGQILDEDDEASDWIELYNTGVIPVDLTGYSIADEKTPGKWLLPKLTLNPSERLLVFASGKNRGSAATPDGIDHWETAIYEADQWRYLIATQEPPQMWKEKNFDDSGWQQGPGGFGYGDNDDVTPVPTGQRSIYLRRSFQVSDANKLKQAIFSMDYDDGFVAYLNGVEIARSSNMGGGTPAFDQLATPDHEAQLYTGGIPETFALNTTFLNNNLQVGTNTLAIQVHNSATNSSDFTARPWLHFGISDASNFYGPNPVWFSAGGPGIGQEFHSNFKLSIGEKLYLFDTAEDIADSVSLVYLTAGHSRARLNDDGNWCIADQPTPDAENGGNCTFGYAVSPQFSIQSGFHDQAQSLAMNGVGEIRYTTDGKEPDENSTLYTAPLVLNSNTVVKARCFQTFRLPSQVTTASFFIGEKISLPVVSVSFDPADFESVYTQYNGKTAATVEYFDKDKQRKFIQKSSAYVVGNWSVAFPQKSMQFDAEEAYGASGLFDYPIFAGDKPIQAYKSFRIRNEDDDFNLARMRDRVVNQLALPTHAVAAANNNVVAFINGQYWGIYSGRERLDNNFCQDNFGCDPDSVTMIKTHFGQAPYQAEYGDLQEFYALSDFMNQNDLSIEANYKQVKDQLDVENFADYFATEIYVASTDWLQDYFNNIRLFKCSAPAVKWKFMLWDVSYSSGAGTACVTCDVLGSTLNDPFNTRYGKMFKAMLQNTGFRHYFINRFADLMNYYYTPERATALIQQNANEMAPEINRHDALWATGDSLYWRNNVKDLSSFYQERMNFQRGHILDHFNLAGTTLVDLAVQPPGAGQIRISTITPESPTWSGYYFQGIPVQISAIANPGFTFTEWSPNSLVSDPSKQQLELTFTQNQASLTANFSGNATTAQIAVSELNYHSDEMADAGDWLELVNYGALALDLSGYVLRDENWYSRYVFPVGTTLQPDAFLVLAVDSLRLKMQHPGVPLSLPALNFALSNKSDEIHLTDRLGQELLAFRYEDQAPWPEEADGKGYTLEIKAYDAAPEQPLNWFSGCPGGSPGRAFNPNDCVSAVSPPDRPDNYLRFVPNPSAGDCMVYANSPIHRLAVFDLRGNLQRYIAPSSTEIQLTGLEPGVFLIKAWTEKGVSAGKLIVLKNSDQ